MKHILLAAILLPSVLIASLAGTSQFTVPAFAQVTLENVYPGMVVNGQLIPGEKGSIGVDLKTFTLPADRELIAKRRNFGYSDEEINKYFSSPLEVTLDETGLDKSLLKSVPPVGQHPRVFFNPEDLPALRARLQTASGKAVMDSIRKHIQDMITGPVRSMVPITTS